MIYVDLSWHLNYLIGQNSIRRRCRRIGRPWLHWFSVHLLHLGICCCCCWIWLAWACFAAAVVGIVEVEGSDPGGKFMKFIAGGRACCCCCCWGGGRKFWGALRRIRKGGLLHLHLLLGFTVVEAAVIAAIGRLLNLSVDLCPLLLLLLLRRIILCRELVASSFLISSFRQQFAEPHLMDLSDRQLRASTDKSDQREGPAASAAN